MGGGGHDIVVMEGSSDDSSVDLTLLGNAIVDHQLSGSYHNGSEMSWDDVVSVRYTDGS